MKSILSFLIIAICVSCASSKNPVLEEENQSDVQIIKAVYSDWVGGVQHVRGTTIRIVVNNENIKVDTVYFRNQRLIPELKKLNEGELEIVANFNKSVKPDYNLHSNPSKEYGNKVPKMNPRIPFKLNVDECILSYKEKNKDHFLKVKLEKGETIFYQ